MEDVNITSGKVYLPQLRDYCCSGSFVYTNLRRTSKIYLILSTCHHLDHNIHHSKCLILQRATNATLQVMKVAINKCIDIYKDKSPNLSQRQVEGMKECAYTNEIMYVFNNELGAICFIHHLEGILLGKYECMGLDNVYVTCFRMGVNNTY